MQNFRLPTAHVKFQQICILTGSFCWKYIKLCHDTKEWCKIWRKTDLRFQKWQKFRRFTWAIEILKIWTLIGFFCAVSSVNFDYLSRTGEIWKIKKRGWKYGAGAGLLKRGGGTTVTFPIWFFQGLSFLHLEITLPFAKLCYSFEEKILFSTTIILWKKIILSCLKTNLKISHKLR